jgi:type I site-specific restriction endonuclease
MTKQYSFTEVDITFIHDALFALTEVLKDDATVHDNKDLVITRLVGLTELIKFQITTQSSNNQPMTTHKTNLNEYHKLANILEELKAISQRESKRHEMDQHLTPSMLAMLDDEIIPMLDNELDYEPSDEELGYGSESPLTADEMHTAAWRQHQELHS